MKTTKKILAILISAVMILGLLAGCGQQKEPTQTDPQNGEGVAPRTDGMLVFSSDASLNIIYDEEGLVMSVEGTNGEGIDLAEAYEDYLGKSCAAVVKELVAASIDSGYLTKNIIVKQALGSALPGTNFLDTIVSEAQAAADAANAVATVILITEAELDADGYINLETAKKILLSDLSIESATKFDGEPAPKDGAYTFYLETEAVKGYFSVDAVTGIVAELTEEDIRQQEGATEETSSVSGDEEAPSDNTLVTSEDLPTDASQPEETQPSQTEATQAEEEEPASSEAAAPEDEPAVETTAAATEEAAA